MTQKIVFPVKMDDFFDLFSFGYLAGLADFQGLPIPMFRGFDAQGTLPCGTTIIARNRVANVQ